MSDQTLPHAIYNGRRENASVGNDLRFAREIFDRRPGSVAIFTSSGDEVEKAFELDNKRSYLWDEQKSPICVSVDILDLL